MQCHPLSSRCSIRRVFGSAPILALSLFAAPILGACGQDTEAAPPAACTGFVVGEDGSARLSGLEDLPPGHAHGMGDMGPSTAPVSGACVAISGELDHASAASADGAWTVDVTSLRGPLDADAVEHEGLRLAISRDGTPVHGLTVILRARMPHHSGMVRGGHGPANDFQVTGLAAVEDADGYVVDTIDFNMKTYWLFDVEVAGTPAQHLYFAMSVASAAW